MKKFRRDEEGRLGKERVGRAKVIGDILREGRLGNERKKLRSLDDDLEKIESPRLRKGWPIHSRTKKEQRKEEFELGCYPLILASLKMASMSLKKTVKSR